MKIRFNIQQKIQIFILTSSILIYIVAIGVISIKARKMAYNDAVLYVNSVVNENARNISELFNSDMSIVKTLSNAYRVYDEMPEEQWKKLFLKMYKEVLLNNEHIYSLWDSWELSAIDTSWEKTHGRYAAVLTREGNGKISVQTSLRSIDAESKIYDKLIKNKLIPSIWEPYFDRFVTNDKYLMTTLNSPIIIDGKYVGIVAIDITLDKLQDIVNQINPFENSYAFTISHKGIISGHPDTDLINLGIQEIFPEDAKEQDIKKKISKGEAFDYISKNKDGIKTYYSFAPIIVNDTKTPWAIAISVPVKTIMAEAIKNFRISLIIGILGMLLIIFTISLISRSISSPIRKITDLLKKLSVGNIDSEIRVEINTGDEIEEMNNALNNSIVGLNNKVHFADHIGNGNLDFELELLSEYDVLGKSLLNMRNSLVKANHDEEKRKVEDEKRKWANEGLAKFADILRQDNNDLANLSRNIIQNLVSYLGANQGGVFILNEEDDDNKFFQLLAAYAYNRQKFINKEIHFGEGLVGVCAQEKQTIHITEIPQNYIEITSGLGGASPKALLIVPLKLEGTILGVLEIASFNDFEKNEIEFVEKVAESIASTLNSVRINIRTSELLERSQQQSEEMAAQEEEMRQNLEELQATQEESTRKSAEMTGLVEALNKSSYVIEYNLEGYITDINDMYLDVLGISRDEVIGTHHSSNVDFTKEQKQAYQNFWNDLKNGKVKKETSEITVKGKQFIFSETYSPIRDANGDLTKILKISNNITDFINQK